MYNGRVFLSPSTSPAKTEVLGCVTWQWSMVSITFDLDEGVDVICLTAADERAGRVYERVGFARYGSMLAYVYPGERGGNRIGE